QKARGILEANGLEAGSSTAASKERKGQAEALALARSAAKVVVGRGKKVGVFDMKNGPPDDETLLADLLAPTGNLQAPALRHGTPLLVGFSEEAYRSTLGG